MKILGKYKDYYDYLQGIYGVDPILVLDRRDTNMLIRKPDEELKDNLVKMGLFVGGKKYNIYYFNGDSYYDLDDINKLNNILIEKKLPIISMPWKYGWRNWDDAMILTKEWWNSENGVLSNINKSKREPVLISEVKDYRRGYNPEYTPCILSQWDFHKVLGSEETYKEVSALLGYLVDHPSIPNNQSNIEKLLSHGFDKKKSFRHRK